MKEAARLFTGMSASIIAAAALLCSALATEGAEPLVYRRVFVPADALDTQIRDLLPLRREEFERRLALVQQAPAQVVQTVVRVENAVFRARLDGGRVAGSATFTVVANGTEGTLLQLTPCSFAVESAVWNGDDLRAAIFGANQGGQLLCDVDRSGDLTLGWSQRASAEASGRLTFDFRFPPAPRRRLEISTAANVELTIDSGLIIGRESSKEEPDRRIWAIELTGSVSARLEVFLETQPSPNPMNTVVRDTTIYNVSPTSIDFETTLDLDVLESPLRQLRLKSEVPLNMLAVEAVGQNAEFHVEGGGDEGGKQFVVELPEQLVGTNHAIKISGTAARPPNGRWRLPRLILAGGQIQEGNAEVQAPGWMRLCPRPILGCVQTGASLASPGRNLDRFYFQLFADNADIELAPSSSPSGLIEESGTQIHVEASQVTGVFIADLTAAVPRGFAVEVQIPRQWIVDSVETQPPDMLIDRLLSIAPSGWQVLNLHLARPISSTRRLRLTIRAHCRRPANQELLDETFFQLARICDARGGNQFVSVQVHDPGALLALHGGEQSDLLLHQPLSSYHQSLFEQQPGPQIFKRAPTLAGLRAMLAPATPQYHAEVVLRADVGRQNIVERASIHCRPDISAVDSVLVGMSPPPKSEVSWRLAGESLRELPAVLESRTPTVDSGEIFYRVLLPRAQTLPFELLGDWTNSSSGFVSSIALITLPEAIRPQGLLQVHSPNNRIVTQISGLAPLPLASMADEVGMLRGCYRYEANRHGNALVKTAADDSDLSSAWVEKLRLRSQFAADGRAEHEAQFVVHGAGQSTLEIHLPAEVADCRLVKGDGTEEPLEITGTNHGVRVPLEVTANSSVLRIRYLTGSTVTGFWPIASIAPPIPQPNAVVLSQAWDILLPPQLRAMRSRHGQTNQSDAAKVPSAVTNRSWAENWRMIAAVARGPAVTDRLMESTWQSHSDASGFVGWNVLHLNVEHAAETSLWVYRADVAGAWFWPLALIGVSISLWLCRAARWVPALAAVALALAIGVGAPFGWLAEGLALGLGLGGVLVLLGGRNAESKIASWPLFGQGTQSIAAQTTSGAAVLLALAFTSLAAAPPLGPNEAGQRRPKVVIPIDAKQQPIGDYVYVDEKLYDALHQAGDAGSSSRSGWLLESAHYDLDDGPKMRGEKVTVDELRVILDFHTFHDATVVLLPLRREQVLLLEGRARLDSQPAKLAWRPDGSELSLTVPDAGRHRLELALGATARQQDDGLYMDLSIPRVAHATVRLPPGAIVKWRGGNTTLDASSRTVELPASTELQFVWPTASLTTTGAALLEAEQFSLWRVQWGSVVLESHFRLRPRGGPIREVAIEFDPRLRALPPQGMSSIGRIRVENGRPCNLRIELAEPVTTESSFKVVWLWPDASGLGKLELPEIQLKADRLVRNWAAVSLEAGLTLGDSPSQTTGPTAAEFAAAFGDSSVANVAAVWNAGAGKLNFIESHPAFSLPRGEESIDWSISETMGKATFNAQLTDVPRFRFEHQLSVSPALHVTDVSVTQRGRAAASRWEQQADGSIRVTMLEPPESEQTLVIVAETSLQKDKATFRLPHILLNEIERRPMQLRLFRQRDAQVTVEAAEDWKSSNESLGEFRDEKKGRLCASFVGDASRARTPSISIMPNRPRLSGRMLIHMGRADGDWSWDAEVDLQIAGGVVDELSLSVPAEWPAQLEIEPSMDQDLDRSSGEGRRRLVLRPRVPMSDAFRVRLRGPLQNTGDGLQAPDIGVEGNSDVQRLVLLDRGADSNEFDWQTSGLVAMDQAARRNLPADWQALRGDWYQVAAPRFEATAGRRHTGSEAKTQIQLAELIGTLYSARRLAVTAQMTVLPASKDDVIFSLPAGCRLLETLVDEVTVPHLPCGLRSWKLPTPSDSLPYRLTIVYDTFLPGNGRSMRFGGPQVEGAAVEHILWTIQTDSESTAGARIAGKTAGPCDPVEAELTRLKALTKAIESIAAMQSGSIPSRVLAETFRRWEHSFVNAQRSFNSAAASGVPDKEWTDTATECAETVAKVRQRLQQSGILGNTNDSGTLNQPKSVRPSESIVQYLSDSDAREIEIDAPHELEKAPSVRLAWSIGLILLSGLLVLTPAPAMGRLSVLGNTNFILGTAGIAWWVLAPQGWIGLVFLVAAILSALRSFLRRGQSEGGSTISRTLTIR